MDIIDFYKAGELSRKNSSNMLERQRKEQIRNEIVAYYQDNFLSKYPQMDIEYSDFRNKEVIEEIADIFEGVLENYFSKSRYCDKVKVVTSILVYKNVYVVTAYRKNRPTFDLTGYLATCVPGSVRVVVDMLPSKNKKLQALINYASASGDTETVSQLQEMQTCKLL